MAVFPKVPLELNMPFAFQIFGQTVFDVTSLMIVKLITNALLQWNNRVSVMV